MDTKKEKDFPPLSEMPEAKGTSWALILGGSSGLGLASAKKLAQNGYDIIVVHRDRKSDFEEIEKEFQEITSSGAKLIQFNIDATLTERRKAVLNELKESIPPKSIQALVHSIAKGNLKSMVDTSNALSSSDFAVTLNAMATSFYDWSKGLLDDDMFSKDARLLAFTSEGNTKAWPGYGAVSAAKTALEAIMRNMALEFAPLGIKVNCIQAGVTDTKSFRMIPGHEKLKDAAIKRNPNQRLTRPEDVANVVYLMCREEAKWITGTILKVDGGESLR